MLGVTLALNAGVGHAEPTQYAFSTTGQLAGTDPLLQPLTEVTGGFMYDDGVAEEGTVSVGPAAGSTFYRAVTLLTGSASGNAFTDPLGIVSVGDDKFSLVDPPVDFFGINWDPTGLNITGFSFAGMQLENVRIFWIEGQDGIGDFIDGQSLPSILPPTVSGRIALDFVDGQGATRSAFYGIAVVAASDNEPEIFPSAALRIAPLVKQSEND